MEKDEVSGYQGRSAQSAEMLTANGNAATSASPLVCFPQIHSVAKEVTSPQPPFPWLCPWVLSAPRCGLFLTVNQSLPWHSFEMRTS